MLKKLTYAAVISYLFVLYGQDMLVFGSELRKDFYFIGMSLVNTLFAFILYRAFKNIATSYYLFMCIGAAFNELVSDGDLKYIEIVMGCIGVVYILVEGKIKKLWHSQK